jgi:hypothetical protein
VVSAVTFREPTTMTAEHVRFRVRVYWLNQGFSREDAKLQVEEFDANCAEHGRSL